MDPIAMPMAVKSYSGEDLGVSQYPSFDYESSVHHSSVPHSSMMTSSMREPLAESSGNHQPMPPMVLYNAMCNMPPSMPSISSMPPSSMSASSLTHPNAMAHHNIYAPRQSMSSIRHDAMVPMYHLNDAERNPVYRSVQFRQYRARQEQRQDKEAAIWPPELENPFLDALLLIPIMGRKKYFMRHQQYGRNMLIGDYVWIAYTMGLAPGQPADEKNMKRSRKQISSHIQVLKNFFKYHRYFHFFFPARDKETGKKVAGAPEIETVESISLKNNPVLVALSEGRFPDVRPNYDYFAQLLDQDTMVTVRPKTCHVFVSSHHVAISHNKVPHHRDTGAILDLADYPQLAQNLEGDGSRARYSDGSTMIHEYTRVIGQKESDTLKELVRGWEKTAPQIVDHLDLPEPQDEAPLTIIEMAVTMELHRMRLPSGSELNGLVEMSVTPPHIQGYNWSCITRLSVPRELWNMDPSDNSPLYFHGPQTESIGLQFEHQPTCLGGGYNCNCVTKPRNDVRVPFPAIQWASILTKASAYHTARGNEGHNDGPSAEQLVSRTVMTQELWSTPIGAPESAKRRRALILWRFNGVFKPRNSTSRHDVSASTTWRFLTVNDPTSDYHQQRAYITTSQSIGISRNSIMSPESSSVRCVNAATHENIGSVWQHAPIMKSIGSVNSHGSLESTTSDTLSTSLATPTPPPQSGMYYDHHDGHHSSMGHSFLSLGLGNEMDANVGNSADLVQDLNGGSHNAYLNSVTHPSFNSGVCEPSLASWDVTSGLESWSQPPTAGPGSGGASPYEPTIVDKSGNTWVDDTARDATQNFWVPEQQKPLWSNSGPPTAMPQQWSVRNPWEEAQCSQTFDKFNEAASPLNTSTTILGKRRRDEGSETDENSSVNYKRMSHPIMRTLNRDGLVETVAGAKW